VPHDRRLANRGRHEAGGTTYYFCSTHCAATFDADPDRYTPSAAEK
jgi:Cu+-exporting ATPase